MSNTHPATSDTATRTGTARERIVAVVAATVATVVVWFLAHSVFDIDIKAKANGSTTTVELPSVIAATLVIGLAGWGLLAVLERMTPKARTAWTAIAVVVFLLSLVGGPAGGIGMDAKVTLAALHAVAALVLIPGLARNARKS